MNKFKELITALAEVDRAELPETLFTDMDSAYDSDVSVREARIEELTKQYELAVNEVSALKNELYDLSKTAASDSEEDDEGEDTDVDETPDLEDFFEEIK